VSALESIDGSAIYRAFYRVAGEKQTHYLKRIMACANKELTDGRCPLAQPSRDKLHFNKVDLWPSSPGALKRLPWSATQTTGAILIQDTLRD
jgi:hypothetical protein